MVKAQAQSHKCSATVDWLEKEEPYYPPTVNDRAMYNFAVDVGKRYILIRCLFYWRSEDPILSYLKQGRIERYLCWEWTA